MVGGPAKTVVSGHPATPAWRQVPKFRFFSDSVSLVQMRTSTGGLDEVITNGLASSPHDWLKVENKCKSPAEMTA